MKPKLSNAFLAAVVLVALAGCAYYPTNAPKTADSTEGYYYHKL